MGCVLAWANSDLCAQMPVVLRFSKFGSLFLLHHIKINLRFLSDDLFWHSPSPPVSLSEFFSGSTNSEEQKSVDPFLILLDFREVPRVIVQTGALPLPKAVHLGGVSSDLIKRYQIHSFCALSLAVLRTTRNLWHLPNFQILTLHLNHCRWGMVWSNLQDVSPFLPAFR